MRVQFTDWDGSSPGENVGHVQGAGFGCEVWDGEPYGKDSKFLGLLKQSDMSFQFYRGEYPNEVLQPLKSRKRHTAEVEVIKLCHETVKEATNA